MQLRTDEDILRLCHQGRQEGFSLLLEVYQDRVYRRAYSFLRHREDALDITQDVFMRVINAIEHFRTGNPIWPWLRKITTNTCLNKIRSDKSRPQTLPLDLAWEQVEAVRSESSPERTVMIAWDRELIDQALTKLPPLHRMVVLLRHEEDLTYDEISQVMNLPLGTVKTYLYRARRNLRASLQNEVGA